MRAADSPPGIDVIFNSLRTALHRMVAIQMRAYPDCWSAADKRELAERQLFGDRK